MQKVLENRCQSCKKSDNIWGKYTSRAISPIYIVANIYIIAWDPPAPSAAPEYVPPESGVLVFTPGGMTFHCAWSSKPH